MPRYVKRVHQDFGSTIKDYEENLFAFNGKEAQRPFIRAWNDDGTKGFSVINFWRPIQMDQPCVHKPLAILDPNTVKREDVVTSSLVNYTKSGLPTVFGSLKYNEDHQWYYYPGMTCDEVLIFKQFECFKGVDDDPENPAPVKTVFHTAIDDANTPKTAETRKSCEFRVRCFFK